MDTKDNVVIAGILASPEPFRIVKRSMGDEWLPTIKEINQHSYDYVKLHRFSGTIDIGLADNHTLAITFDGGFILPATTEFKNITKAVEKFNDFFGRLLLGGIYIQAIDATYVQRCIVYTNHYFKTIDSANNAFVELKNAFRHKHSSVKDNIVLLNTNCILLTDLIDAYKKGTAYLDTIKNLTPSILIKGVSSFITNSYAESLIYNWVSIEQIIDCIWEIEFVEQASSSKIVGRKEFLSDTRSWTSSTRIEMLYERKIITEDLYNSLSKIRKARNKFVHTGKSPEIEAATVAYNTLFEMISLANSQYQSVSDLNGLRQKFAELDPIKRTFYERKAKDLTNVQFWLDKPIPDIPGDDTWNADEYKYQTGFNF